MKLPILALLLVLQSCSNPGSAQQSTTVMETTTASSNQWIISDLVAKWENNKRYTLEVLEAMPAEHYQFVPAEGMRTFAEQALHIANGFEYQQPEKGLPKLPTLSGSDKGAIVKEYEVVFDAIIDYLRKLDPDKLHATKSMWYGDSHYLRNFNLMDHHLAHHRGQMVVYLRLKGITPPQYAGW